MPLEPAISVRSRSKNAAPRSMRPEASYPQSASRLAVAWAEAGAARDELRHAALAGLDVEDRLVGGIAADEGLVRDDQARALEHDARRRVEWNRRPVLATQWSRGEALDVGAIGTDHRDLVAANERHVDPAGARDPEPVGTVDGLALPDPAELSRPVMTTDADLVELRRHAPEIPACRPGRGRACPSALDRWPPAPAGPRTRAASRARHTWWFETSRARSRRAPGLVSSPLALQA